MISKVFVHLEMTFRDILNRQIHDSCQDLIKTAASGSLEIRSSLEDFKEFQEELTTQIKSNFDTTHIKIDTLCKEIKQIQGLIVSSQPRELPDADLQRLCNIEEGQDELKQMLLQVKDLLKQKGATSYGDDSDSTIIEEVDVETRMNIQSSTDDCASAAEDTLVRKINELLNEINSAPVPKKVSEHQIRTCVQRFLLQKKVDSDQEELTVALMELMIDIIKQSGTSILTAEKSCIIFRIRCTTYGCLLSLLEYLGSEAFAQRLHMIASALTKQNGTSCFLTAGITAHSLQHIWKNLTRKPSNIGKLMTRKRTLILPIRCSNSGALEHVWKLFQERGAEPHLKRISNIISKIVGGKVVLSPSINVPKFKKSLLHIGPDRKIPTNLDEKTITITVPLQVHRPKINRMDPSTTVSVIISDTLGDIGINEENISKRRKVILMMESFDNLAETRLNENTSAYFIFGSQAECTTTDGLNSDTDIYNCMNSIKVITHQQDLNIGESSLEIIQNEMTPPGYFYLHYRRNNDISNLMEYSPKYLQKDLFGRRLLQTCFADTHVQATHGPAALLYERNDSCNVCLPCYDQPKNDKFLLYGSESSGWPTKDMKRYASNIGCFLVPTPIVKTDSPDLEWKIYYALEERCLMFNLNMTQIRCLVLMKIILKVCLYPLDRIPHSSVICKTVLFYCIRHTNFNIWRKDNLWCCLTDCFKVLYQFVLCDNCPHFFLQEDNLIYREISLADKNAVLQTLQSLIDDGFRTLLAIKIDCFGQRLQEKVNFDTFSSVVPLLFHEPDEMEWQSVKMVKYVNAYHTYLLSNVAMIKSVKKIESVLKMLLLHLTRGYCIQTYLGKRMYVLLCHFVCTTFGSVLASQSLQEGKCLNHGFNFLLLGQNSDIASGRLKMASVLYCRGQVRAAQYILEEVEILFHTNVTEQVCSCKLLTSLRTRKLPSLMTHLEGKDTKWNAAFCVKFLSCEKNIIPKQMQYELFSSRLQDTEPVQMIAVDALPCTYYLLFNTYKRLGNYKGQIRALESLILATGKEEFRGHRGTTFNLLGQCMEDVGRHNDAFKCYKYVLGTRGHHNIANVHICRLLARYFIFFQTLFSLRK